MNSDQKQKPKEILIDEKYNGLRLDKFISQGNFIQGDIGRSYIQDLIKDGHIKVNSSGVKPGLKLQNGDRVLISVPEAESATIIPEDIDLDVIYEDQDILIINKPKGMVVHPAKDHWTGTLVNALLFHYKDNLSDFAGQERPGIVHRLDKDTTGILLVCKNNKAHSILAGQFQDNKVKRIYQALVYNHFNEESGKIEAPISRHPKARTRMAVNKPHGKYALTNYKLIENLKGNYAQVECSLVTGRTHQIRVHMSSINHPIVGDLIYGNKKQFTKIDGPALHANLLGFNHPRTGDYLEFIAPLGHDFINLKEKLNK